MQYYLRDRIPNLHIITTDYAGSNSAIYLPLTQPDHGKICEQLSPHASQWQAIGQHLGFLPEELSPIQAKPLLLAGAPKSYLSAMLASWLQWAPAWGCQGQHILCYSASSQVSSGFGHTATIPCFFYELQSS